MAFKFAWKFSVLAIGTWFVLQFVAPLAHASEREIKIEVKGMVCSFCAQGIEKKFLKQSAVEKVKVSLESGEVNLILKDGQNIPDAQIETILKDSGFAVEKIKRVPSSRE